MILADLETVSKRLNNIQREVKRGDKEAIKEDSLLQKIKKVLDEGKFANSLEFEKEELNLAKQLNLLTMKPIIYGLNKKAGGTNLDEVKNVQYQNLSKYLNDSGQLSVVIDAKIEDELKEFEGEEKETLRKEFGSTNDGINDLIRSCYDLLGLITYFTTGEDETRGWTIKKDETAPEAGAAIHTDFMDKFIRAEVVFWKDLLDSGSYAHARERGLVRTEGRDYIVKDGDVIEFKI